VFRFVPPPVDDTPPSSQHDDEDVAGWFSTETDPAILQAVAKAEADARTPVDGTLPSQHELRQ
jgi:hypothetical protein